MRRSTLPVVLFGCLLPLASARDAHAALVYIGGGDEHMGAYDGYRGDPAGWTWVRAHADGYYINTFPITTDPTDATQKANLSGMSSLFTNKNVFYETELDLPGAHGITDADDVAKLAILQANGFTVTLTTCNLGVTDSRTAALKTGNPNRPVYAMDGPWTINGDINSSSGANWRSWIQMSDGSATDSPLALWATDGNMCREASYSDVKYTHSLKKTAMLMACPHGLGTDANWYTQAVAYVGGQEDNDAIPDIWAISYYAAYLEAHAVTPEQVNGVAAQTVTGVGYYLIHHLRDPDRAVQWTVPAAAGVMPSVGGATIEASGNSSASVLVWNTSSWLDFIPVIQASVSDPDSAWNVTYALNGQDVTADLAGSSGLTLYKARRLLPSSNATLVVSRTLRAGASPTAFLDVKLSLSSHPSEPTVLSTLDLMFGTGAGGESQSEAGATEDGTGDSGTSDGGANVNVGIDAGLGTSGAIGPDGGSEHAAPGSSGAPPASCGCKLTGAPVGAWSGTAAVVLGLLPWIRRRRRAPS